MSGNRNPHIRVIFQRSSSMTKLIVLLALILSMAAIFSLRASCQSLLNRTDDLNRQAQVLAQENRQLEQDIRELGTVDSVEKIAAAELGLVKPGTILFEVKESNAE